MTIKELCKLAHKIARSKNFWELCPQCQGKGTFYSYGTWVNCKACINGVKQRNFGELIALIHSELSEALEGLRHGELKGRRYLCQELLNVIVVKDANLM